MSVTSPAASPPRDWIPGTRDLLIDGQFVSPQGERWPVYNPATEQVIATVGGASAEQVDAAVTAARAAFPGWAALPGEQRSRHIHRRFSERQVAPLIDRLQSRIAELESEVERSWP